MSKLATLAIYGCGDCGSEHSYKEMLKAKRDNKEGYTCLFCMSKNKLEYLGRFSKNECYNQGEL